MLDQIDNLPQSASEILGDLTALAEQLGGTGGLGQLPLAATSLELMPVRSLPQLRKFLDEYAAGILIPHELPAIAQAHALVHRYEIRELIALDQALAQQPALQAFARASQAVGRQQLQRLRPLRSERAVQRYLRAVENGEAQGWHNLVFGLVLAIYSLPLRQGLVHFAHHTLAGFIEAANSRVSVAGTERQRLLSAYSGRVTSAVEAILAKPCISSISPIG